MNVIEIIKQRRSIRKFKQDPIDDEILKDLEQSEDKSNVYLVAGYILRLLDEKKKESSTNFLDHYDNFYTLIDSKKFKKVINYWKYLQLTA